MALKNDALFTIGQLVEKARITPSDDNEVGCFATADLGQNPGQPSTISSFGFTNDDAKRNLRGNLESQRFFHY